MTGNHRIKKQSSKLNGRWSKSEHERFIKGYNKFGKNWTQIQKIVKTRTLTQVRSHAQKVFMNCEKNDLDLSCASENSDMISYQESSFGEREFQNSPILGCMDPNNRKKTRQIIEESDQGLSSSKIVKEGESPPTLEEQLPSKQAILEWVSKSKQPSHFLMSLAQHRDFLSRGGNFVDLCLWGINNGLNRKAI